MALEPLKDPVANDFETDTEAGLMSPADCSARLLATCTAILATAPPRALDPAAVVGAELAETLRENVTLLLPRLAVLVMGVSPANAVLVGWASISVPFTKRS